MIKEKLDELVAESLERILENPETKATLAQSTDVDVILSALLKTSEFQKLLAGVRGLADTVSQLNENVGQIVDTLKIHQSAIKNLMTIQDVLTKQKASKSNVDLPEMTKASEKPSKPN